MLQSGHEDHGQTDRRTDKVNPKCPPPPPPPPNFVAGGITIIHSMTWLNQSLKAQLWRYAQSMMGTPFLMHIRHSDIVGYLICPLQNKNPTVISIGPYWTLKEALHLVVDGAHAVFNGMLLEHVHEYFGDTGHLPCERIHKRCSAVKDIDVHCGPVLAEVERYKVLFWVAHSHQLLPHPFITDCWYLGCENVSRKAISLVWHSAM